MPPTSHVLTTGRVWLPIRFNGYTVDGGTETTVRTTMLARPLCLTALMVAPGNLTGGQPVTLAR